MEFSINESDIQFQQTARNFLRSHLPTGLAQREAQGFHLERKDMVDWQQTLFHQGWVAPGWPAEFGGTGWTPMQRHLYEMEYGKANAPEISVIALSMVGPVIYRFGSDALKKRFLQPILRGDIWFCQGFSEPQAGSDLANLKTRARREISDDGESYVITGQKTWTTAAHFADYMICLARTDTECKPQAGLSMLIVPMDAPGVTVRPIATIDGDHTVNEVFLDEVRVPAVNLIGTENSGWNQAKFLLGHERTHNAYIGVLKRYMARIPQMIQGELQKGLSTAMGDQLLRRFVELDIDVTALEWSVLRVLSSEDQPELAAAASALKVRGSQLLLRASELELEILGPQVLPAFTSASASTSTSTQALPAMAGTSAVGRSTQYLYWRASTVFGGSNEIQRSIIWNTLFRH